MRVMVIATLLLGCATSPILDEPAPAAEPVDQTAAVDAAIARARTLAGLPSIRFDERAAAAARGHCEYIIANAELTHIQQRGKKKFTGVGPGDRLRAAGFTEEFAGEVLADTRGDAAIFAFINSVYHRALFLRAETTSYGYGDVPGCATIDFGRTNKHKEIVVLWPPNGATDVPTEFAAAREVPNPVKGAAPVVGAPVSLIREEPLGNVTATIVGPSGALPATLLTHESDPAGLVRIGEAHLVPLTILATKTTYRAEFHVNGEVLATTFTTR